MEVEGTWVDSIFVQVSAWYIGLDMKILVTSAKAENPFIIIAGSINNINNSSDGPQLLLGNYSNVHYQSLLPLQMDLNPSQTRHFEDKNENLFNEEIDDFIFMHNGDKVIFYNAHSAMNRSVDLLTILLAKSEIFRN